MLFILLQWIVITLITLSFGNIFISVWNKISKREEQYSFFDTFWLGLAAVSIILMAVSLFLPISIYILIITICISLLYWGICRVKLKSFYRQGIASVKQLPVWGKAALLFSIAVILLYTLSTPLLYDEGLYHLQSMMWNDQYSIIPGLANLHGRLGFNSTFLLLSTLFHYHPSQYGVYFTLNGLCLFIFSAWLIKQISERESIIQQLILAFVLLLSTFTFGTYLSSTSTDILANILTLYILLSYVLSKDVLHQRSLILGFLPIFCITLKLSSAVILLACLWTLFIFLKRREYWSLSALLSLGVLVAVLWCTRFVVLTGYLVYPFPEINIFSFDWKLPTNSIIWEKEAAYAWARVPNIPISEALAMPLSQWIPIWLSRQSVIAIALLALTAISPLIILFNRQKANNSHILLAWGISVMGCMFWFFTAPDFRFGVGMILACAFLPFFGTVYKLGALDRKLSFLRQFIYLPVLVILLWLGSIATNQLNTYKSDNQSVASYILQPESLDILKNRKNLEFDKHNINDITFYNPTEGDQCFDQSLPCMTHFKSNLEMRGSGLSDGFRIKQ